MCRIKAEYTFLGMGVIGGEGYSLIGLEDRNTEEWRLPLEDALYIKSSGFAMSML